MLMATSLTISSPIVFSLWITNIHPSTTFRAFMEKVKTAKLLNSGFLAPSGKRKAQAANLVFLAREAAKAFKTQSRLKASSSEVGKFRSLEAKRGQTFAQV
jgi:hypothetical protein